MPSPSPEARARDNAKQALGYSYIKDGRKCYGIHIGNLCGCCWIKITKENSWGNGYCEFCMRPEHEIPCEQWTDDMVKFWNKHKYKDRHYFDMSTREFNKTYVKKYANI